MQELQMMAQTSTTTTTFPQLYHQYYIKNKISSLSIQDQFRLWAQQTIYFDNVVIFWTMAQGKVLYNHHSYNPTTASSNNSNSTGGFSLELFIQWCAERRCIDGIPISMVLYAPSCCASSRTDSASTAAATAAAQYRTPIPYYSSSVQSFLGIRVRQITTLPSMTTIFQKWFHSIYMDAIQMTPISTTTATTTMISTTQTLAIFIIQLCHSNPARMKQIWYLFEQQDHSVRRAIQSIQRMVAHDCAIPTHPTTLSFMTMVAISLCNRCHNNSIGSSNTNTTKRNGGASVFSKRVTSLFYDDRYHELFSSSTSSSSNGQVCSRELFHQLEEYEVDRYMSSIALQLYNYILVRYHNIDTDDTVGTSATGHNEIGQDDVELHTSTVMSLFVGRNIQALDGTEKNDDFVSANTDKILNDSDRQSIISYIVQVIRRNETATMMMDSVFTKLDLFDDEKVQHQTNIENRVQYKVNELIVLLDHCITVRDVNRCMDALLWMKNGETSENNPQMNELDSNRPVHVSCPRRDHVRALVHDIDIDSTGQIRTLNQDSNQMNLLLINVPGIMYRLIQNRVTVTEIEWYQAFLDHVENHDVEPTTEHKEMTTTNWFHIFGCGIRHLQISGLIRRNEGRNNSIQYERTALVWCGGD